jgi:hypothetical protein
VAVTLTDQDVTQPLGELDSSLFPGSNFAELVNGWLYQAQQKVQANAGIAAADHNDAAAAWVYYRAYSHVAQRLAASPTSVSVGGKISRSMAADQRKHFFQLAAEKLAEYSSHDSATSPIGALFTVARPSRVTVCS